MVSLTDVKSVFYASFGPNVFSIEKSFFFFFFLGEIEKLNTRVTKPSLTKAQI